MPLQEIDPVRGKYITPDRLGNLLSEGGISYIEFDEVAHLDFRLIQTIDLLRAPGRPLAVNIRRVKQSDNLFSNIGVDHFFRSLDSVDFVIASQEGDDFTLRSCEEALSSKVHFINRDIGEITKRRMRKRISPYASMLSDTAVEQEKFVPPQDLAVRISQYQQEGKSITIACGTFDVLHPGHIAFLEEAARLGDIFFVLTNSDYSMRLQPKSISGDRPIHPLVERIALLSSFSFVNHVSSFDEPTAEMLFGELKGITYVKTEKDRDRPEVLQEQAIVTQNNGQYVELPPFSDMARGIVMSSTDIIYHIRNRDEDEREEELLLESRAVTSETVEKRKKEISDVIKKWNKDTGIISALAKRLRERFEEGITGASEVEQNMLGDVTDVSSQIAQECGNDRSYYGFIIPELLGSMIGLDIRTISVQENTRDSTIVLKNILKRSDGKVTFFHVPSNTISDVIAFEEEFWRSSPYNVNYLPYNRQHPVQKRVYLYPEPKHTLGMTLRILMEEYAHTTDQDTRDELGSEVTSLGKTAFMLFEGRFFEELEEADNDSEWSSEEIAFSPLPKIIGHGGASVMKTSGGAIGFAENTHAGILNAFESGVDVIEVDVVPCKDGWVISHDIRLSISTDTDGLTTDKTEDEIRKTRIRLATGEVSDEYLLTLSDTLAIASKYSEGHDGYILKLDVKFSDQELEGKFVDTIKKCGIPLDKILITSGFPSITQRIAALCPELPFELNTVEPTIFLTQYELMDEELMPRVFLSYVQTCAQTMNARVVSMMHFGMQKWGDVVTSRLLTGIARMGLDPQVWVVSSMRDYQRYAAMGASYALMHDPKLIERAVLTSRHT